VLFLADSERGVEAEDEEIAELLEGKKVILVINKTDLAQKKEISFENRCFETIELSAKTGDGIQKLLKKVEEMFDLGEISKSDTPIITKAAHKQALCRAKEYIDSAKASLGVMPDDFISIDLRSAAEALGEITGIAVSEEVVDRIFSKFCLGK